MLVVRDRRGCRAQYARERDHDSITRQPGVCVSGCCTSDPAVFRTLPQEIRAELVTTWWNARADVIAARKWASEAAAQQLRDRPHNNDRQVETGEPVGANGGDRKRGRRGSDVGVAAAKAVRSIRDFLS